MADGSPAGSGKGGDDGRGSQADSDGSRPDDHSTRSGGNGKRGVIGRRAGEPILTVKCGGGIVDEAKRISRAAGVGGKIGIVVDVWGVAVGEITAFGKSDGGWGCAGRSGRGLTAGKFVVIPPAVDLSRGGGRVDG